MSLEGLSAARLIELGGLRTICSAPLRCVAHGLSVPCDACEMEGSVGVVCDACGHHFSQGLLDTVNRSCESQAEFTRAGRIAFAKEASAALLAQESDRHHKTERQRRAAELERTERERLERALARIRRMEQEARDRLESDRVEAQLRDRLEREKVERTRLQEERERKQLEDERRNRELLDHAEAERADREREVLEKGSGDPSRPRILASGLIDFFVGWTGCLVILAMIPGLSSPFLTFIVLVFFYHFLLDSPGWGGTLGKRLLKLKLETTDGKAVTGWRLCRRSALLILSVVPGGGWPWLIFLFTKKHQSVHDLVCGTVIRRRDGADVRPVE